MGEVCPYCGKECGNTKALGSHISYVHGIKTWGGSTTQQGRSDSDKGRFQRLFDSCLSERDLPRLRGLEKIEEAIGAIPQGVSPALDKFRDAYSCALGKERMLKEFEELLREEEAGEA